MVESSVSFSILSPFLLAMSLIARRLGSEYGQFESALPGDSSGEARGKSLGYGAGGVDEIVKDRRPAVGGDAGDRRVGVCHGNAAGVDDCSREDDGFFAIANRAGNDSQH